MKHILVIKLGALGDFVQATAAFQDIRAHHKGDHITLLTTPAMMPFAQGNPNFDAISIDKRKGLWNIPYLVDLRRKLRGFDMVYDLQTNDRSSIYHLIAGRPAWSGIAAGCSHPHSNPNRNNMHSLERIAEQLSMAELKPSHTPDVSYMAEDVSGILKEHGLKKGKFTLLIPGGSAHRPGKRWPHFAKLAQTLIDQKEQVVLIGARGEADILSEISDKTGAINLCGQTSLGEIAGLCLSGKQFVGNDTGPSHIAAACGLRGIVLFGSDSNPDLCAPRQAGVSILHKTDIGAICEQEVLETLKENS